MKADISKLRYGGDNEKSKSIKGFQRFYVIITESGRNIIQLRIYDHGRTTMARLFLIPKGIPGGYGHGKESGLGFDRSIIAIQRAIADAGIELTNVTTSDVGQILMLIAFELHGKDEELYYFDFFG